jgi:hypothetical protein
MSVSRIIRIVVALSSLSIAVQSPLRAQLFRGTITGTIVDASGAFVPDAQIQVEEQNTASIYKTVSNSEGRYTALSLAPGVYRVTVEKTGFKRHVGQGIQVSADEHVAVNVKLEVGNVIDSVVVTTEAPLIQTETGTVGQVFGMEQGDNVPLNGRTAIVLAWTAYGVSSPNSVSYQELRPYANAGAAGFSMGGAPLQTNDLQIDGGTNNTADLRVAYNPPEDAVAEVKVESLPVDAASGHTGGGSVNVITKSGTNTLHGSAYEFNRVSNLTANLFFNNLAGAPKQPTLYNQWGSSLGGPLMIPKVLDGRNRVFIFLAYEGIKERANTPVYSTVPTAAQRNGDFSGLLALGASYQIYDPLTGVVQGSRISRQPFPNNIIPASRFNPIAQAYLSRFYPLPNVAGTSNGLNNFYAAGDGSIAGFNNTIGRLDFNLSDRHKLFVSGRHNNYDGSGENLLGHPLSTTSSLAGGNRTNFGAMVDDVYTFSPTMVMDTRLNWTQYNQVVVNFSSGFDITSLGFPQALKNVAPQAILPNISFSTYRGVGAAGTGPTPYDAYQIFSTVSKQANQHSIKFGVDFRQTRSTALSAGNPSGTYTFGTSWTNGPLDNSSGAPIGQDMASFLLGLPTSGGLDINSWSTLRVGYYAGFIQDDYHVTPSLTLNLGLRYEKETPTTDVYDRSTKGFDMTAASPINAAAIAAYANNPISQVPASQFHVLGGLLFTGPGNRALYSTSSHSFAPRIGFAFSPPGMNHKLVVRGAVGIFYFPLGNTGNNLTGFNQNTPFNPTTNGYLTPAATLSNPFPNGILQPVGAANGLATYMVFL